MKRALIFFIITCTVVISGCNFKERETEIQRKTEELTAKEQQLLLREKSLQLKEDSLNKILSIHDSISFANSIETLPPALRGEWTARMVCTASECQGSVIGDTQTDNWQINEQEGAVIIKSLSRGQINRIYTGNYYKNNTIKVGITSETPSHVSSSERIIEITDIRENRMTGTRVVIQPDGCRITYSLELEKKR